MKKSLLALAVLGVFAGAAQAQSSITIYGLLDQGLILNSNANAAGQNITAIAAGTYSSRFGFTGTEDLGGGLKANFRLESQIQPDTGTTDTPTSPLFRRAANVGLAGNFGSVTLGRQSDPFYIAYASGDTRPSNLIGSSLHPFLRAGAALSNITPLWVDNAISYTTPTFSGFKATVYYSFGEQAGDSSKLKQQGLTGAYANGPLTVNAGLVQHYSATGIKNGQGTTLNGGYSFGPATVRLSYSQFKDPSNTAARKYDVYGLSALYAASATVDLSAGFYKLDDKNNLGQNANILGLEGDYKLSKRTTLYVVYGRTNNGAVVSAQHSPTGTASISATGATALAAETQNVLGLGVRHTF